MTFVLGMAVRETRASWRRLLFFFVCIAVGVGAIVALRSVIQNVRAALGYEARSMIAADVLVSTNRDWTPMARTTIEHRLEAAGVTARTETIETPTMVRPADNRPVARMVELRAVQSGFPLYGTVKLAGGLVYSHALLAGRGALVRPELLTAIGAKVGDALTIGRAAFTIRGVIVSEPGRRIGTFSLGPRVLIDYADVPATELLAFGTRARHQMLVRLPDNRIEPLVRVLTEDFKEEFVSARSYRAADDEVGRDFNRAENYLSLVGLVIVILGGIAVSSVTRVFVLQKMRSIAVLKCVGATSVQVIAIYVLQMMTLGLAGSLLGVLLARGALAAIPLALGSSSTSLLAEVQYGVTWSAGLQGVGIGVLVALLFSIVPLLQVRVVKPSLLLRDDSSRGAPDVVRMAAMLIVAAALVALTAWQVGSWRMGLFVCGGFCILSLALVASGWLLVRLVSPLARSRSFVLRHAVLHLSRPGNQTRVILLAVGLGAFFIVGVRSLQRSLLDEFSLEVAANAPDMFLMDIQKDQADGVRALLAAKGTAGNLRLIPVLRARVTGVSGRNTALESYEDVRARGSLAREYTVTYRDRLEPNERVVDGQFWTGPSSEPEVSVEESVHDRFRIDVGDTVRFDILGRLINARVTSIRTVDWRDSRSGGFMFLFRPGTLEQAPQTFIAPLKGPATLEGRALLQSDLVARFPNVSVIDFREVLEMVRDTMSKVTLAISVVGGLVLFSGGLILVGAVAMTKFQRVYEAAVFRTLGANTRTIAQMLLVEYSVLGLLAGLVGSVGAIGLTWAVSRWALDIPWRIFGAEHGAAIALTGILVGLVGVLSSADVLRHKPLATLRAE